LIESEEIAGTSRQSFMHRCVIPVSCGLSLMQPLHIMAAPPEAATDSIMQEHARVRLQT